jgi:hypothetical protein
MTDERILKIVRKELWRLLHTLEIAANPNNPIGFPDDTADALDALRKVLVEGKRVVEHSWYCKSRASYMAECSCPMSDEEEE